MKYETRSMKQEAHGTIAVTIIATIAASLIAGALLGHFGPQLLVRKAEPAAKAEGKTSEKRADRSRSQSTHEADLNRLRARIKQLERQLAEQDAASEEPVEQPATNRVEGFRRFGPPTFAELEDMRKNDPERYVQTTNRIAQFRAGWQGRLQHKFDILESADTAHMTEKQRKVHEDYISLLARIDELGEQLNPLADVTEEQRRAAGQEMRESWHRLHELQRIERDTLLTQTANALGFRGRKAQEVVEGIKQVYEATGGGGHWGRGGRGGRG
ncbi:MAG: hypothetical protein J6V72_03120, partial [Kiritimatiellae bacterium]|nr:hypothetical protein [Kiritimatiellia bacterium]